MNRRLHPGHRTVVTAALLAALVPGAAGCAAGFEAQTVEPYTPGDGVNADVNRIKVRSATLVASEPGGPASLVVALVNESGRRDVLTRIRVVGSPDTATIEGDRVALPPGELVVLGTGEGPTVTVEGPNRKVAPGNFVPVRFTFRNAGSVTTDLLVQKPEGDYATVAPEPEPTPTLLPGSTESPLPEETLAPGETETPTP
ncbi:MAG: hypothetical protein ACRDYU_13710 [Actinomycetes bacterium]